MQYHALWDAVVFNFCGTDAVASSYDVYSFVEFITEVGHGDLITFFFFSYSLPTSMI